MIMLCVGNCLFLIRLQYRYRPDQSRLSYVCIDGLYDYVPIMHVIDMCTCYTYINFTFVRIIIILLSLHMCRYFRSPDNQLVRDVKFKAYQKS